MKKSVFTLLAIATMVVSMSSCSQNDGGSSNGLNLTENTQDQPKDEQNLTFVVCTTPEQLAAIDMKFVVEVNGEEKTLDAAQMTESNEANKTALVRSMTQLKDAFDEIDSKTDMRVMTLNLGKYSSAHCHFKSVKWALKEGYTEGADVNILCCYGFTTEKTAFANCKTDAGIYKSIPGDKTSLTNFCNIMNEQGGNDLNF